MKAVSLLLNSYLPEELRSYDKSYDVGDINRIMRAVALKYPDRFAEITKKISDLGRNASYVQGETITLKDLEPVIDKKKVMGEMADEIKALPHDKHFDANRRAIFQKYTDRIEKETAGNALARRNNIALSVLSGARGKKPQLRAMISPVGTFSDYKGEVIDVYSKESFADGIRPTTFLASTYGSRAAVTSSKAGTAKGGDLAKQFASIAADMVIRKEDCGTSSGIALSTDDPSLKGRVLAQDAGPFRAGQFITREMVDTLKKSNIQDVVARSPMTCGLHHGLCAKCVGKLYGGGKLPKVGDAIGLTASSTTMEPVTQMALCLVKGTLVRLMNGKNIPIESVKPGMKVKGFDDLTEKVEEALVLNRFVKKERQVRKYVLLDEVTNRKLEVTCSGEHKFLTEDSGVTTIDCCVATGDKVMKLSNGKLHPCPIISVSRPKLAPCYDIEIDTFSHLFLLHNGLITSNSAKHTAGMTKGKKEYSGLSVIQQFAQSPEKFKDRGVVAELDGTVDDITEAPQGGSYVTVGGERHYIPVGHEVLVKPGDVLEAGDQLAEGLVDAEDIVRLKGLGEGRRYYAERLNKILEDSGAKTDKRNTEILARAAIRHVRITDPRGMGDFLPDDVVDYNALQDTYVPDEVEHVKTNKAIGTYLAQPALHYTIGTRITPKVAKALEAHNYWEVDTMKAAPDFQPEMVRLRASSHTNPDWLASMGTSYLTKQLNEASVRGEDTNVEKNPDYRPRLMYGKDFGKSVGESGEF